MNLNYVIVPPKIRINATKVKVKVQKPPSTRNTGHHCVACENNAQNNRKKVYFNFPKDPIEKAAWLQLLNVEESTLRARSRVCDDHFEKSLVKTCKLKRGCRPKNVRKVEDPFELLDGNDVRVNVVSLQEEANIVQEQSRVTLSNYVVKECSTSTSANRNDPLASEPCSPDPLRFDDEDSLPQKELLQDDEDKADLCLICSQLPDPLETNNILWTCDSDATPLSPHLWSMFVLKLLNYPKEECSTFMKTAEAVNPSQWFTVCGQCSKVVEDAFDLEQKLQKVKQQLQKMLKSTLKEKEQKQISTDYEEDKNPHEFNVRKHIRSYFQDKQVPDASNPYNLLSALTVDDDFYQITTEVGGGSAQVLDIEIKTERDERNQMNQTQSQLIVKSVKSAPTAKKLKRKVVKPQQKKTSPLPSCSTKRKNPSSHKNFKFSCPKCPAAFQRKSYFSFHLKAHRIYTNTTCSICNYPFRRRDALAKHLESRKCENIFPTTSSVPLEGECYICHKVYDDASKLKRHLKKHRSIKRYTCTHCLLPL